MHISHNEYAGRTMLQSRTLDLHFDLFIATKEIEPNYKMSAFVAETLWLSDLYGLSTTDVVDAIYDQMDYFVEQKMFLEAARVVLAMCDFASEKDWPNLAKVLGERARQYLGFHHGKRDTANEEKTAYANKALLDRMLAGASFGGRRSAETRRAQSKIPRHSALDEARAILISQGHDPRRVASILAKRYGCTAEHIRTMLKKKESA